MKIPVFVSCPTDLNPDQEATRQLVLGMIDRYGLEPRALGRSDYPVNLPLGEVLILAKHCSGGVILGFEQFQAVTGIEKRGTPKEKHVGSPTSFPTPWNQLEGGILCALQRPLLVFKEASVSGGVFGTGTLDVFVHRMPRPPLAVTEEAALNSVFLKWQANVREIYYRYP